MSQKAASPEPATQTFRRPTLKEILEAEKNSRRVTSSPVRPRPATSSSRSDRDIASKK